ncbi:MAG: DUF2497 domain-containing protein [Hyphomicrobiales bacterium]|nr:DUF2497 domain-containing protein [Hyphomicrobiales bacterium]
MDSIPRQEPRPTPGDQPPSPVEPVFAKKPNPMVRPAVHTQPGQSGSGGISEFVETKPPMDNNDSIAGKQRTDTEASLHPAIVNAKSHVSIQRSAKNSVAELAPEKNEIPVFESTPSSVDMPMEKLISPDNTDRRDVDERRSHPLRRGVDRAVSEVRKELMSPTTTDSVHTAFEQLKNMTLEGLDSNVREMIRPMLREWLDNNLPSMVERLVRDEIERVSRGE